ncbi:flippase [Candidatus Wolfebacteria bacterium]|nr:flippase [Candidatus Wolfebacteria bacterium]
MTERIKNIFFRNKSSRQTVAKNVFWLGAGQIGSRLIRAIIIIYSARILGAAEYGVFSYVLNLAGLFTALTDIGIGAILTRELIQKPEKRNQYFGTSFFIKTFILAIAALIIIFAGPHFSKIEAIKIIIPIISLVVIFDTLRDFSLTVFRAEEKMEREAIVLILTNIAIVIFGFAALYFSKTAKILTWSYIAGLAVGFLIAFFILKDYFLKAFSSFSKNLVKPIISAAYPLAFLGVLGAFMINTDMFMLGWWRTAEEIGYYSAGQKIIQILYLLPGILASALFPVLSRFAAAKENKKIKEVTEKGLSMIFFIAIPMALGGIILAGSIIEFVFGKEYLPATLSFQILLLTAITYSPLLPLSNLIVAKDKQQELKIPTLLGAGGNIFFNILFIPVYGIAGSSAATVIAQIFNTGLIWKRAKKINDFSVLRHLKKIVIATIIMGIFTFALRQIGLNVILNILISIGIYLGVIFLLKEKIINEIIALVKGLKKA